MTFKEIPIGEYALRFWPSDNGWICGITPEMIEAVQAKLAPRPWVGLTEDEIELLAIKHAPPIHPDFAEDDDFIEFARAIQALLKEKNT
jgi:hypothetical protein